MTEVSSPLPLNLSRQARLLYGIGVLQLVLGALHLAATPLLWGSVRPFLTAPVPVFVGPAFLLNHVLVGVLFLPVGATMLLGARAVRAGERTGLLICTFDAAVMIPMPLLLVLIM